MNKRVVLLLVAMIVAVGFTLIAKTADRPSLADAINAGDTGGSTASGTNGGTTSVAAAPDKPSPDQPNFEMKKLAAGEQPPQFIIFSFDGAGSHEKWQDFMATAKKVNARFTGFLTGIYLLDDDHKTAYTGPGHAPGKASVSFGGTPDEVTTLVGDLNTAYQNGFEIGTHYNGHFCDGNDPSGNDWSTDAWNSELDQFFAFMADWKTLNGYSDAPDLKVPAEAIRGGRTPCLEGDPAVFFPAMEAHGMTYDSSQVGSGIQWPAKIGNVWEFYMPYVRVPATGKSNIAMDYNFWISLNGGANEPGRAPELAQIVLDTYRSMYDAASTGNRAPLVIGNHFNNWSGDAFNPAVKSFMQEACVKPDTVCTTYQNVIKWMDMQDPAVLAELLARPPVTN